jgi:hypothetical protein
MLRLAKQFWSDQAGFIVSAELVLISTVGVIGLVTGLTCLRNAVNDELSDVACAISSLDQSYCYTGFHSYKDKCRCMTKARTAGSTNVRTTYEEELVQVDDVAPRVTTQPREGVIVSEKVISERVISDRPLYDVEADEQAIDRPAKCEECPNKTEAKPTPADSPAVQTPVPDSGVVPVKEPAPEKTPAAETKPEQ